MPSKDMDASCGAAWLCYIRGYAWLPELRWAVPPTDYARQTSLQLEPWLAEHGEQYRPQYTIFMGEWSKRCIVPRNTLDARFLKTDLG